MAEKSYLWTTNGTGDGDAGGYTQADWSDIVAILAGCAGFEGVAPSFLNALAPTANGANTIAINTGGAVVDGKIYKNSASINVNIPSASGAGNTRIDRIVLRASWAAQTIRVTRIAGVDAASPSAPDIVQTPGTTYDITLCRVLVDTSGAVTITDERVFAQAPTMALADGAVSSEKMANNAVTNAKLRDSAALSVLGRPTNTAGDPSDIVAGVDATVLKRAGNTLAFGQITNSGIADGQVNGPKLANDSVDDTKVGARVPQFYRRQGGSATNWWAAGANNYVPGMVRMQAGVVDTNIDGLATVTFPVPFGSAPIIVIGIETLAHHMPHSVMLFNITSTGFSAHAVLSGGENMLATVHWLAMGPE